jgi:glutamine cyclotransferase
MTWHNGEIVIAVSAKNRPSVVFSMSGETFAITGSFEMPRDATHTSGLASDGQYIWAVDYSARRCYEIDLAPSLSAGAGQIRGTFDTSLEGTSACCFLTFNGGRVLAISQFRAGRQTVFVDHQGSVKEGSTQGHIVFSYRNEGFSQGLEYDGNYLYESENKAGGSVVNRIDIDSLRRTRDSYLSTVVQYNAPGWGVEDLAWDGRKMWTADEYSLRLFRTSLE